MLILECSQGCYGRTDGSVTISLRNFVSEGIISFKVIKVQLLYEETNVSFSNKGGNGMKNMSKYITHVLCVGLVATQL